MSCAKKVSWAIKFPLQGFELRSQKRVRQLAAGIVSKMTSGDTTCGRVRAMAVLTTPDLGDGGRGGGGGHRQLSHPSSQRVQLSCSAETFLSGCLHSASPHFLHLGHLLLPMPVRSPPRTSASRSRPRLTEVVGPPLAGFHLWVLTSLCVGSEPRVQGDQGGAPGPDLRWVKLPSC